ncbi:hypothetical protein ILYODFUR_001319, partial [Ilyodon furcidens]
MDHRLDEISVILFSHVIDCSSFGTLVRIKCSLYEQRQIKNRVTRQRLGGKQVKTVSILTGEKLNVINGGCTVAQLVALLPCSKKVLASTPGQGTFCMEFACFPR